MNPSLSITFRGMEASPAFDQRVRELMARMTRIADQPLDCRVVVESPHRHSSRHRCFSVRMQVTLPGRQIVVCRTHCDDPAHADPYIALQDAFRAARRKLIQADHLAAHHAPPTALPSGAASRSELDGRADGPAAAGNPPSGDHLQNR